MWAEITKHLYRFESAVLSGLDEAGYPFSVRCRPYPDASGAEVLTVWLPPDTPLRPGPASLLCHSHDENLWNLESFLVRGVLVRDAGGWSFHPGQFIPGVGIGDYPPGSDSLPARDATPVATSKSAGSKGHVFLGTRSTPPRKLSAISYQPKSRRLTADS